MNKNVLISRDCDKKKEECFFYDCDENLVHVCLHCTRNKAETGKKKEEDYSLKFQKNGY